MQRTGAGFGDIHRHDAADEAFRPERVHGLEPWGAAADLSIAWPASLSKSVGLTLRVRGRIVRAEQNCIALTMTHYEFRTRSLPVASEQGVANKDIAAE